MDREDLKYIEDGKLIDNGMDDSLDESINIKKFNISLISTDKPNVYNIIDEANGVAFEMICNSDEEAIMKFEEFGKALDETNANVLDFSVTE